MARYTYNFDIVGNLVITDGVASGFSSTIYGTLPQASAGLDSANWEFGTCITTGSNVATGQQIFAPFSDQRGTRIEITSDSKFGFLNGYNGSWVNTSSYKSSYTVLPNTTYYLKASYSGNTYSLSYSLDGESYTTIVSYTSTTVISPNSYYIGNIDSKDQPFLGSIDLTKTYIKLYGLTNWEAVSVSPDYSATHIQLRRDTASNWESVNPVLLDGEVGIQKPTEQYNINLIGDLVNSRGILSGFGGGSYATIPDTIIPSNTPFDICVKFMTSSYSGSDNLPVLSNVTDTSFFNDIYIDIRNHVLCFWNGTTSKTGTTPLITNIYYYFRIVYDGSTYNIYLKSGDYEEALTNWTLELSEVNNIWTNKTLSFGRYGLDSQYYTNGNIDLNGCYISTNNTKIWKGSESLPTKLKIGDGTTAWNDLSSFDEGKADTDLANVTNSAKTLMSGMGMPSRRYAVLVLGDNASIYTAPANGYYSVTSNALTQAGKFYRMINRDSGYMRTSAYSTGNGDYLEIFLPVRKGDTVIVYHNGPSTNAFSFTYAQGSESEV